MKRFRFFLVTVSFALDGVGPPFGFLRRRRRRTLRRRRRLRLRRRKRRRRNSHPRAPPARDGVFT